MIRFQRTLKNNRTCEGVGLHTGKPATMILKPAPVSTGIVFIRTNLENARIKAVADNTTATSYATTLSYNGASVKTVEHLLAAFAGLNIDNAYVEINSDEVPIMDGSARPFVRCIADAGIQTQEALQPVLKVIKPVFVREGGKQIAIWPADATSISYFIDFNHPMLKEQSLQYEPSAEAFLREVSDARTFGFLSDVKTLQANGLAKGASLDNAVALNEDSVLNKDGLRYKDEFVRHKILDLLGDLSLAGMPIVGHIVAHKSGHSLNAQMAGKLLNSPQNWIILGSGSSEGIDSKQQEMPLRLQHATV
jgi:UDP-3-O-[3-hydroxymyristoyl] N-acetylglucosamine deacetylase